MWNASVKGLTGIPLYQFSMRPLGSTTWSIVRDFNTPSTLPWTVLQEGSYQVSVAVNTGNAQTYRAMATFMFTTRITTGVPVVSVTQNPLVALYSAPPCISGVVTVSFWPTADGNLTQTTSGRPCQPGRSLNFYVAGMKPATQYTLQQSMAVGHQTAPGPSLTFKTGTVTNTLPTYSVMIPPNSQTDTTDNMMLMSFKALHNNPPFYPGAAAFDLLGNVLWYYFDPESPKTPENGYLVRPVQGGTMLLEESGALREIDLAGNVVRETNKHPLNTQLTTKGLDNIICLSHEGLRLPNGHTVTIGSVERILNNVQGPGNVDVVGNMVLDLDPNFQVAWTWNTFDFLDNSRQAVLREPYDGSCPLSLAPVANDWTHANSLLLTADGNLLGSLRNQDWIVKINYQNGAGDGSVIWKLGNQGDFNIVSSDPWPWFSHQHDIEFDGVNYEVFDNGNTRVSPPPLGLGSGDSRGYVFSLDETNKVSTVLLLSDLKTFSPSFGSAQLLSNGNYAFLSGNVSSQQETESLEVLPNGTADFGYLWQTASYRWFRLPNIYTYTE